MEPEEFPNVDQELEDLLESYYSEDPQLGDIVFLKHGFDDSSLRGEVTGLRRHTPQRSLNVNGSFEIILYSGLDIMIGGLETWLDLSEWEITDKLRGSQYKKLPPEIVRQVLDDEDSE
jgi:hypothetical protein